MGQKSGLVMSMARQIVEDDRDTIFAVYGGSGGDASKLRGARFMVRRAAVEPT